MKKNNDMKLVRLFELQELEKAKHERVQQAFTFGLKLQKDGLPDKFKLFSSLNQVSKNYERFGMTKAESRYLKN